MKLNQYHKQAIVLAIEQDIPKPSSESLRNEIQTALYKAMSKSAQAMYRKNPDALRRHDEYDLYHLDSKHRRFISGDANVKEVMAPFYEQAKKRSAAISALKAAVEACSTRKQFVDRFPEFSNYAPTEEGKCATLPALANVVAGLIEVGFVPKVTKGDTE